jgi:hypothetical protein
MAGKNVLQQLFTAVAPSVAAATASHPDAPRFTPANFSAGGQQQQQHLPQPPSGLGLNLAPPEGGGGGGETGGSGSGGSDGGGAVIELNLGASNGDIPVEQLRQAKRYMDHERDRAAMFKDVAISSGQLPSESATPGFHQTCNWTNSSFSYTCCLRP